MGISLQSLEGTSLSLGLNGDKDMFPGLALVTGNRAVRALQEGRQQDNDAHKGQEYVHMSRHLPRPTHGFT